jgi:hypothetical protein
MTKISGYRNLLLGLMYLGTCSLLAHWSPGQIVELGGTFGSLGLGVTGVVAGRAANKWAEGKNGGLQ